MPAYEFIVRGHVSVRLPVLSDWDNRHIDPSLPHDAFFQGKIGKMIGRTHHEFVWMVGFARRLGNIRGSPAQMLGKLCQQPDRCRRLRGRRAFFSEKPCQRNMHDDHRVRRTIAPARRRQYSLVRRLLQLPALGRPAWSVMGEVATGSRRLCARCRDREDAARRSRSFTQILDSVLESWPILA